MRVVRQVVTMSALFLAVSKSQPFGLGENATAVPTTMNTSMPVVSQLNSTAPSLSPIFDDASPAPTAMGDEDGNATASPTTTSNVTNAPVAAPDTPTEAPVVASDTITNAPVVATTTAPVITPTDAPIHHKDEVRDPKSKHGVGNDGISASAIFGMVVAVGLLFVGAFFVFGKRKGGGGRRDGMREMEMSTWVNNNDNDGLL